jgi:hypothetical protein
MAQPPKERQPEDRRLLRSIRRLLARRVRKQPYPMLSLAMTAGYVAGGGLFSSFTRLLARASFGALLVPGFRERLRRIAGELREDVEVTNAT